MRNDLIERYIYAVTKDLPRKSKEDIRIELGTLIADMLEERCDGLVPTERDVRVVLAELGKPSDLAEKYNPDEVKCLIGPPYFMKYKFVLKIVLVAVAGGMTLIGLLDIFFGRPQIWYMAIYGWFGTIISSLFSAFAIVTAIFGFMQWRGVSIDGFDDGMAELPPVPMESEKISLWEPIVGIGFGVIFTIMFLFVPEIVGGTFVDKGIIIPFFNVDLIRSAWPSIIGLGLCGIIKESYKIYIGQYTMRLGIVALVTNTITIIIAFFLFLNPEIINPEFLLEISGVLTSEDGFVMGLFENINYIFLGVISFAATLDTITTLYKGFKYSNQE
ncbi:MAG: hypothetical protein ACRCU3_02585 [Eubacteriaceae bacterium]